MISLNELKKFFFNFQEYFLIKGKKISLSMNNTIVGNEVDTIAIKDKIILDFEELSSQFKIKI